MKEATAISPDSGSANGLRRRLFWVVVTIAGLLGTVVILRETPAEQAFKWFGRLGFPDVKGCNYVRVATGDTFTSGDKPPANSYLEAFLLNQSNEVFTVLTDELVVRTFTMTPVGTPAHQKVGFEVLDLGAEADARFKRLKEPRKDSWPWFGQQMHERDRTFVLAWGCDRNGESARAQRLFEQAAASCGVAGTNGIQRLFEPVRRLLKLPQRRLGMIEQLERDLGHAMMWRAVENFGDPAISRPALLAQFRMIVSNYPGTEHRLRAQQMVERLTAMIAEDAKHPALTAEEFVQLGLEQRTAELIYQLRDHNGRQFSQPGWCDIFMDYRGTTNTPAHELVRIGYPAVPQLIAALDDRNFTRSVGFHRSFYFSHTVLTVGDCAAAILQRLSGKSFPQPHASSRYQANADVGTSGTRTNAEAWWAEFQRKGEKQMLMDCVSTAGDDAPAQARLLLERYPAEATAALVRGARVSTNEWTRVRLVELVADQTNEMAMDFLWKEMIEGPIREARVMAAFGLRNKGHREAVTAMIREWDQLPEQDSDETDGLEELMQFLAGSDSIDAIAALCRNLSARPVATRMEIVEKLGEGSWPFEEKDESLSPATLNAMEEVLINALQDQEEQTGMSGSFGGKSFSDPRVCDFAAYYLAKRWPDRYEFDFSGSLKRRDRQIGLCQNVWRRMHGIPELSPPIQPLVQVRPEDALQITAIEWATKSAKPTATLEADVARLKGTRLTKTNLVQLLISLVKSPSGSGFSLKAIKHEDLTGVRLMVQILPGTPPTEEQGWDHSQRITLGAESLYSSMGGESIHHAGSKEGWDDFAEAAAKALAGPAEMPFVINVKFTASED